MSTNQKHDETKDVIDEADKSGRDDEAGLSLLVQEEIGRRLRAVYGNLAQDPLPDRFTRLLQKLSDNSESERDK